MNALSGTEAQYLNNDVSNGYGSIDDTRAEPHGRVENGVTAARHGQSFCNVPQGERQLGQYISCSLNLTRNCCLAFPTGTPSAMFLIFNRIIGTG